MKNIEFGIEMEKSSERDDHALLQTPARVEPPTANRNIYQIRRRRNHWGREKEIKSCTNYESHDEEGESYSPISAADSTLPRCRTWNVKPKVEADLKPPDVSAPVTPARVTRKREKQSTCECKEVVKKICRRSLGFERDQPASQASILSSEDDQRMTAKIHDAKHIIVYHRRKKVKKPAEMKMITRKEMKLIDITSTSEEPDKQRSEWWEKEADLLHERVNSFICAMRLIQGEIQFSSWKGSVMDSIGGAYLTQNVNDTHSSSAFMSLAAKFPRGAAPVKVCKKKKKKKRTDISKKRIKKEHDNQNILQKCHSEYHSTKTTYETSEALDWDSVRRADVHHISQAIQIRGMNNHLAERIKKCLDILMENFGSTNMEWLRDVPSYKAKKCLMSIYGLGVKSVECICLLTLQQKAFPIDRNVGRLAVRLGWVPLKPLPEGQEFHLLKTYPRENSVQTYLWPRLCKLDHSILYELHCQMMTCAKVFCTKRNPNCNVCPMRVECKHFASSVASSQQDIEDLGGEMSKTSIVLRSETSSKNPTSSRIDHQVYILPDSHHVLAELEEREPNDSCPYLLAIWTLNGDEHIDDEVFGTILIPVRTAVRGTFPLNGTYFQANEVFADDASSEAPIKVPRASLLNLERTTLYCGNYMSAICKGMSTSEVENCFKRGFVCFRGFNRKTREPKSLSPRFRLRPNKAGKKKTQEDHVWNSLKIMILE